MPEGLGMMHLEFWKIATANPKYLSAKLSVRSEGKMKAFHDENCLKEL